MQGRAFLEVAREVVAGATEAHWRATVIHAYYALFLECRDALTRWGIAISLRQNAHSAVRLRLMYAANVDLKSISRKLDDWCRYRNQANYHLSALPKYATDVFARDAIRETTPLWPCLTPSRPIPYAVPPPSLLFRRDYKGG